MKAKAKFFRGIEYVVETELPENQQAILGESNALERIKILIDGKIIGNCFSYEAYSLWYHSVYIQKSVGPKPIQQEAFTVSVEALNKAS